MFLSETAVLGAPERKLVVGHLDRVHPGVTGVEPFDPELGALQVTGEDRRAEPELRVVGTLEGFVEVLDPCNRQERTKGLLAPDPRVPGDISHDGRLEEKATVEGLATQPFAAGNQASSAIERILQLLLDALAATRRVHGAHLRGRVAPRRDLQLLRPRRELLDQLIRDGLENVHALDGEARLSGVEEAADRDRLARLLDVRVVADNCRVTSTQLQGDVFEIGGRLGHHLLAGLSYAGKPDLADLRIFDHLLADSRP